ncbi:DUF7666 domain-containing protein [Aggregatibacter kilianii]|uniref:DUF7666 domain-containing protein n=1 Tax=Aggregatibacter kilianii TaxID=2025884 RepID=UPI000D64BAAB|nr:hypothetical protein [Aggregatibacter kilianii]
MTEKTTETLAYKGFNKDWTCRDYQYKVGETYEHKGKVKACGSGFHACEYPLDVFNYYPPSDSKFAIVQMSGEISKDDDSDDTKIASAKITIETEIKLPEMVNRAVEWIKSKVDWGNSAATNTGDYSAATNTGYQSAATNTGDYSAATNTGTRSAATNTGDYSAATNTGTRSAATNTGYQSAAEVSGKNSVAVSLGRNSKAKAGKSGAIVCVYRNDAGDLLHIRASIVGENGIKPDTWYTLGVGGEFLELPDD